MPVVPTYTARQGLDSGSMPRVDFDNSQFAAAAQQGRALQGLGAQLGQIAEHQMLRQQQTEDFKARVNAGVLTEQFEGIQRDAAQNMPEDGQGWTQQSLERFDKVSKPFLESLPERVREEYQGRLTLQREQIRNAAAQQELQRRGQWVNGNLTRTAEGSSNALAQDPDRLPQAQADFEAMVNAAPIDAAQKRAWLEKGKELFKASARDGLVQSGRYDDARNLATGGNFFAKLRTQESGGRDDARASTSSATGRYQFTDDTWRGLIRDNPNAGLTPGGRLDPAQQETAIRIFTQNNAKALAGSGYEPTEKNLYLAHFMGAGGAIKFLREMEKNPGADAASKFAEAAGSNKTIFYNKDGSPRSLGEVYNIQTKRFAGTPAKIDGPVADPNINVAFVDQTEKQIQDRENGVMRQMAQLQAQQRAAAAERFNTLMVGIADGSAGVADIQKARTEGWLNDYDQIKKATSAVESRDKATEDLRTFEAQLATPGAVFNPYDKDQKNGADAYFKATGGNLSALRGIVEKTNIMPASAAVSLRGAMVSPDPVRAENALQVSANLMRFNPNVFAGVEGGGDLEKQAGMFGHYVDNLGFSAREATQRVQQAMSPEYQAKIRAKVKGEDVDQIVKKQLSVAEIGGAFDASFLGLAPNPNVGFDPADRQQALSQYAELFREFYMDTGDVDLAKSQAQNQMKKTWGVSSVSGKSTVTQFPPEMAKVYKGIENVSELWAKQALDAVKEETGKTARRDQLIVKPIRSGVTARTLDTGQPLFFVAFRDDNGVHHMVRRPFYADAKVMREQQTAARKEGFDASAAESDFLRDLDAQDAAARAGQVNR